MDEKTAVVTGASQGVGRGIARELVRRISRVHRPRGNGTRRGSDVMRHTGKVLVAAALAREYAFTDVDGKTPRPLTIADV